MSQQELKIKLAFGGGAELLFGNIKNRDIVLDGDKKCLQVQYLQDLKDVIDIILGTLKDLLVWMKDNILKERPELFIQDDTVRPGILVLVNDSDWELLGELSYELQSNDTVLFISTLHGG